MFGRKNVLKVVIKGCEIPVITFSGSDVGFEACVVNAVKAFARHKGVTPVEILEYMIERFEDAEMTTSEVEDLVRKMAEEIVGKTTEKQKEDAAAGSSAEKD